MKKEDNDNNYKSISNEVSKIARLLRVQIRTMPPKSLKGRKVNRSPANTIEQVAKLLREQIKK